MSHSPTNVAVFGSTGSIGQSTLQVAKGLNDRIKIVGLSAYDRLDQLVDQAKHFRPGWIIAGNEEKAKKFRWPALPGTEVLTGPAALEDRAGSTEVDTVVAAIVGTAGLRSTWAAIAAGKNIALANKETLVAAGPLVVALARETGARILPVDSEHSAVFQCMRAGRNDEISRIYLTASGGPFRDATRMQMDSMSPEQALAHPTWDMGQKISIDSATMMNKALEIIEARWLFDLEPDQIEVVVHPQSIVHSLVEFKDGSVIAQMSPPDMKLPIQYALTFPERVHGPAAQLDFRSGLCLEFTPPDISRFPALALGSQVARLAGTSGAALNAANEAAVQAFLDRRIGFNEIVRACQDVLQHHPFEQHPTLDQVIFTDRWAREEINKWILV